MGTMLPLGGRNWQLIPLIEKALVIFIILHIIYYQELVIMSGAGWVGAVYKTYTSRDGKAKQGCQIM